MSAPISKYELAHAAGWDAGTRSAQARGLESWDSTAWNEALKVFNGVYGYGDAFAVGYGEGHEDGFEEGIAEAVNNPQRWMPV